MPSGTLGGFLTRSTNQRLDHRVGHRAFPFLPEGAPAAGLAGRILVGHKDDPLRVTDEYLARLERLDFKPGEECELLMASDFAFRDALSETALKNWAMSEEDWLPKCPYSHEYALRRRAFVEASRRRIVRAAGQLAALAEQHAVEPLPLISLRQIVYGARKATDDDLTALLDTLGILGLRLSAASEGEVALGGDIPAEFRDLGENSGPPLTTDYVKRTETYNLSSSYLSRYYEGQRRKIGRQFVYEYKVIAALSQRKNANS